MRRRPLEKWPLRTRRWQHTDRCSLKLSALTSRALFFRFTFPARASYNGFSVTHAEHNPLLALMLAMALAVGGCLPCQNLFAAQPVKKNCCKKNGECQKPAPEDTKQKNCSLQSVKLHFDLQKDSYSVDHALIAIIPVGLDDLPALSLSVDSPHPVKPEYSPPPLFLLHSTFLI